MSILNMQRRTTWASCVALGCLGFGCGDDALDGPGAGGAGAVPARVLRVASSWATAGDQEALQVVLSAFSDQTGADVEVVPLAQGQAERTQQFRSGDWDVGQENAFFVAESFSDGDGGYTALDLAAVPALEAELAQIFPEVRQSSSVAGRVLALPMNLHRENTLIYSKSAFSSPPSDLAQLRQVCTDFVTGGKSGPKPLAIAPADWLYRILFESLLPAPVMDGTAPDPHAAFSAAAELIRYYIDSECLWVAPTEQGWTQAAQALIDGEAMMYIHGDWAKAYLTQLGWTPGVDFDVAPAPGSEGAFYYGIDVFALRQGSPREDLAIEFARVALSHAVQAAFSAKKGSTPGIEFTDPERSFADPSLLATYRALEAGLDSGVAVPVRPWMGLGGNALIVPLRDGTKTPAEVADDFMTVYPRAP